MGKLGKLQIGRYERKMGSGGNVEMKSRINYRKSVAYSFVNRLFRFQTAVSM